MVGEADVLEKVGDSAREYSSLIDKGIQLQKELEGLYIRHEAHIRKRVALIDEVQSCLTEERRCLEAQHQDCRVQISTARRNTAALTSESTALERATRSAEAVLLADETALDAKLEEVSRNIAQEDEVLNQLLDKRAALEQEESNLKAKRRRQQQEEEDLERALKEIESLAAEIEQRKTSLVKKDDTIAEWNRSLEMREKDLVRCQEQLRADLRLLEQDETRHGISQTGSSSSNLLPVVSQREVMDDYNMSIERESDREEIDVEEEDD